MGMYSFLITILVSIFTGLSGLDVSTLIKGMFPMLGISICIYISVLPMIAFCGRTPGFFMGGSVIGFDTISYMAAKSKASIPLGLALLGTMLLISALIIAGSKTPDEAGKRGALKNLLCNSKRKKPSQSRYISKE